MNPRRTLALGLLLFCSACASQQAFENRRTTSSPDATSVQALIGAALFDDSLKFERQDPNDPNNKAVADLSQMPLLGIAGQYRLTGDRNLEAGLDGALIFSWWKDSSKVVATGGGSAVIYVSTRLFMTDISFGAYASTVLGDWLRLYAAAGPLLMFADGSFENEVSSSGDSGFGVGGYARAGAEFRLDTGAFLGLGVRATSTNLDFGTSAPDVDADALQVMLTFTKQF